MFLLNFVVRAGSVGIDEDDVGDAITQGCSPPAK